MAKIGTAFQATGFDNHLWIVISEPTKAGEVLCVNVTDAKNYPDSTCHLAIGDHEFIKKPSVIVYKSKSVRLWPEKAIDNGIRSGSFKQYADFTKEILEKIITGAFRSEDMPPFRLVHVKPLS